MIIIWHKSSHRIQKGGKISYLHTILVVSNGLKPFLLETWKVLKAKHKKLKRLRMEREGEGGGKKGQT